MDPNADDLEGRAKEAVRDLTDNKIRHPPKLSGGSPPAASRGATVSAWAARGITSRGG